MRPPSVPPHFAKRAVRTDRVWQPQNKRANNGRLRQGGSFPVLGKIFPDTRLQIPCSVAQGIWLQAFEFAGLLGIKNAARGRNLQNSLLNSLLAREFGPETSSQ
jgi:hypothetical protein